MEVDTVVAIATPPGRGALGVIRLSGPASFTIASALSGHGPSLAERRAALVRLKSPDGNLLDQAIITGFRGPRSYTGEDMVEISCHGSALLLDRVVSACLTLGARPARPGEFTLRGFLNGRIDLTQAEAITDIVEARSQAGLELALNQLEGELRKRVEPIRTGLLDLLALMTALVEFSEEDIPVPDHEAVQRTLQNAASQLDRLLANYRQGQVLSHGVSLAIVGPPNAGKSSILNGLLGRQRAIVTSVPGTTRDTVEEALVLQGVPFLVVDTAGITETEDPVEAIGVERSRQALDGAEIVLLVLDSSAALGVAEARIVELVAAAAANESLGHQSWRVVVALNKSDLPRAIDPSPIQTRLPQSAVVDTRALEADGLDDLRRLLPQIALDGPPVDGFVLSNERHHQQLSLARDWVSRALEAQAAGLPLDLVTIDVREAVASLGNVLGVDVSSDILDAIFSRFCIGK